MFPLSYGKFASAVRNRQPEFPKLGPRAAATCLSESAGKGKQKHRYMGVTHVGYSSKKLLSNGKHDDLNHGIWGYPIFTQSHMFRTLANPLVDLSYPSQADGNRLPRGHL